MAGKETARPYLTMSGGSCNIAEGTRSAAADLGKSGVDFVADRCAHGPLSSASEQQMTMRVPGETREAAWQQRENQAANTLQECHVCRFGFTDAEAFQEHVAAHSRGKNHNCSECGKLFVTRWHLTRHLGIHREPSVECGVCGEKFHTKDSRRQHMYAYHVGSQH